MKKLFVRIDDRLLHGQVVVSWIPYLKATDVVIADDEYANDEFMRELIMSSSPEGVNVYIKTISETADFLKVDSENNVLVLLRTIEGLKELLKRVKIKNINIGGIGAAKGRKRYYNSIHLSDHELNILKDMAKENVNVEVRILPRDKALVIR
ncbi:MAG TPA: PTS sugar transporter subunit IIB [Sedimentibacter sp.]|nr:PTS sugar transporter subunit IIB [Sedimentibacter sp.]HQB63405.1 PTS sugar transporter subunit IIB [Sedimentibacter sp.]